MRNFEERKAEIFRRSEMKIKERKRRYHRIVIGCASFFVCVTGYTVLQSTFMFSMTKGNNDSMQAESENVVDDSLITKVEVLKDDYFRVHIDRENLDEIETLLDSIVHLDNVEDASPEGSGMNSQNDGYTIIITKDSGYKERYLLVENVLIDVIMREQYVLDKSVLSEFQKVLGIPANS